MPNSPLESGAAPDAVRAHLSAVIPESTLHSEVVHHDYAPLVLFRSGHVMAAFAFANGDMTASYQSLYGGFKHYYAARRSELDSVDLSFVFCVRPDVPSLDLFCSHVETDVYFCRKFVVPLTIPVGECLARLPFLPLARLSDDLSLRPPSAQTFLQRSGIPTTLAKYLAMQRQRSPEGIVEDCLSGEFGNIEPPRFVRGGRAAQAVRSSAPVRFEALTITDFRAYRKSQLFEFGSDLTVLYGPNGFGKTSFFDAVDFAVTGDIGRLNTADDGHFRKAATHLDGDPSNADVSLVVSSNGTTRRLTRRVTDRNHAVLDGTRVDRKTILTELTGATVAAADRVENLVSLFRATHLFSQEHQELAKNFRNDCELSEQVVSRLLAFEDYARAIGKAETVRDLLRKEASDSQTDAKRLRQEIMEAQLQLQQLGEATSQDVPHEKMGDLVGTLRDAVQAAGIETVPEQTDLATVRAWRAQCEQDLVLADATLARATALAADVATLPMRSQELQKLDAQILQLESDGQTSEALLKSAETDHRRLQAALSEQRAVRQRLQARAAAAEWLLTVVPTYRQNAERLKGIQEELLIAQERLAKHRELLATSATSVPALEAQLTKQAAAVDTTKQRQDALKQLHTAARQWDESKRSLRLLEKSRDARIESRAQLTDGRDRSQKECDALAIERDAASRLLALDDQNQTTLRRLIAELESHISDSVCPLCGHDHTTQETLLVRIREHVEVDRAQERRRALEDIETRVAKATEAVAAANGAIALIDTENKREQLQREQIQQSILEFETLSLAQGIVLSDQTDDLETIIDERLASQSVATANDEARLDELQRRLASERTNLSSLEQALPALASSVTETQASEREVQRALQQVREDERAALLSPDTSTDELSVAQKVALSELEKQLDMLTDAEERESKAKIELETCRERGIQLTQARADLQARGVVLRRGLSDASREAEQLGLNVSALNNDSVSSKIADLSTRQTMLRELRDKAASVERSLDAATTAAVLESLRTSIVNKERLEKASTVASLDRAPWIEYFEATKSLLLTQQNDAIDRFTREYGPRTSVIQRRLRSVYGFDSIELQSQGSKIRVRVTRNGEELRPTDFFSQSQQQTLLLGLFLTACISQTWSTLSPIFLDDPVTHFDDLNTYAFLDLIVGLLESEPEQRQFVISTCDEKFLQLARQKARHLGNRARFYTFSAIGGDGPVVEQSNRS